MPVQKCVISHFDSYRNHEFSALNPLESYKKYCAVYDFHPNPAQLEAMRCLHRLYEDLKHYEMSSFLYQHLPHAKVSAGLYIHGHPGAGKTMMMDIFFDSVPTSKKMNLHFHEFMLQVHHALEDLRRLQSPQPLKLIAAGLASICRVLCLDEMYVADVADAMILKNLFKEIFAHHIVLVTTSNFSPDMLYQNGIQREQFEPFIDLLGEKCQIFAIDSGADYREANGKKMPLWHMDNKIGRRQFMRFYHSFTQMQGTLMSNHSFYIKKYGREIMLENIKGRVIRTSFASLCDMPLFASDYLALCEEFDSFFIEDIPLLTQENRNELKRFILLVDILYSRHKNLICLASALPQQLYQGESHQDEFSRTVSRLLEMEEYEWINQKSL